MNRTFTLAILALLLSISSYAGDAIKIVSPNKSVTAVVDNHDGKICMSIFYGKNTTAFEDIPLGISTSKRDLANGMTISGNSGKYSVSESYTMVTGKRSKCSNEANCRIVWLKNKEGEELDVEIRAYNDGVTFRYVIPKPMEGEALKDEATAYQIKEGVSRWLQIYHPDSYEDFYPCYTSGVNDGNVKQGFFHNQDHQWGYPALVEPENGVFALLTESNIERDHCGSILSNNVPDQYKVTLGDDQAPIKGEKWQSPWRVVILGKLATIVESTLVTDVAEPAKTKDTKWIQPGVASWIYWAYNHGSQEFSLVNKYTDLAKDMHWPYTLIDAEWDVMRGGTMEEAVQRAVSMGIKPMIWYNSDANWTGSSAPTPQGRIDTPEKCDKEFARIKEVGVSGIKIDFFKNDNTWSMNKYLDLLECAQKHKLQIVFHGCTVPRGWQRTYPHLMTCEAVYGAEWYNNNSKLTNRAAAHNATLPFTRNVIGSMDYTPGTFTDSQNPHITSHAHELALTILFESGIQHMPDRPEAYQSMPKEVKDLLSTLPTAWDDTKLLSGYPGKHVVIARRKGKVWYVAGINGSDIATTLSISIAELGLKKATVNVICDDKEERSFKILPATVLSNTPLNKDGNGSSLRVPCLPRGGFVAVVTP